MKIRLCYCITMLCVALLSLLPASVFSKSVSENDIRRLGSNAFYQRAAVQNPAAMAFALKDFTPVVVDGDTLLAILNFDDGFLMMAADDASQPVLAYAFKGSFRMEEAAPGALAMLQQYKNEIQYLKKENVEANDEVRAQWASIESIVTKNVTSVVVSPLITAMWNQTRYYNRYSPLDQNAGSSYDYRTPNGCVAVAMAMIMYYYRYPLHGTGSHTNQTSYGNYYVNFAQQTYNYEMMCDELSNYNNEVAKLIFHCATSVDMIYGADGSGAYSENVPGALKTYFGYSSQCAMHHKYNYSDSSWIQLLQSELDAARPMYYSGYSNEGGHAFVCDGYDSDNHFHFNFGWGGSSNGYYALSNANNAVAGFSNGQAAITHFYPGDSNYPYHCNSKVIDGYCGTLEDGSSIDNYNNNEHCEWVITEDSVYAVFVNFDYFHTQQGHDSLSFWDGHPSQGHLLMTLSGNGLSQSSYTFITDSLYVIFDTDDSVTAAGWRFSYQVDRRMYACHSGNYNTCSGTLTDGSGDANYKPNAFCIWKLRVANATWIKLYFDEFDISPEDELRIYDQNTSGSQLLYSLAGSTLPDTILIEGSRIQLTFLSDNYSERSGFTLHWTTDCATDDAVTDYADDEEIYCYPNPANDKLTVRVPSNCLSGDVIIYDMTGRTLMTQHWMNAETISLDVKSLANGIYLVQTKSGNRKNNAKLIVRH